MLVNGERVLADSFDGVVEQIGKLPPGITKRTSVFTKIDYDRFSKAKTLNQEALDAYYIP